MTSPQFLELMLSLSVQAAVVVVITHWLGRVTNSEQTKCQLWAACHAFLLLLVGIGLLLPHLRVFHPWSTVNENSALVLLDVQQKLGQAVFWVWAAGFSVALVAFVLRTVQVNRFIQTCREIDLDQISLDIPENELAVNHSGARQSVTLLVNDAVAGPFCWQFHRPYIVLPDFLLGLDHRQLQLIIRHELAHLEAGHPVQLFVQRVVEMIFWFHPMVWWSSHQSALAREFACDAAAVDSPGGVSDYLHTLLAVIQAGTGRPEAPSASISFGRGKTIVAKRAERLVAIARGVSPKRRLQFSPSAAYAGLFVLTVLVSFVRMPVNISASSKSPWSPWPTWSAQVLHDFGVQARDFETYDHGFQEVHELLIEKQHSQQH